MGIPGGLSCFWFAVTILSQQCLKAEKWRKPGNVVAHASFNSWESVTRSMTEIRDIWCVTFFQISWPCKDCELLIISAVTIILYNVCCSAYLLQYSTCAGCCFFLTLLVGGLTVSSTTSASPQTGWWTMLASSCLVTCLVEFGGRHVGRQGSW